MSYEIQLVYTDTQKKYTLPMEIFEKVLKKEDVEKLKEAVRREVAKNA